MKVRCRFISIYPSGDIPFIKGFWYKVTKVGKHISIIDHKGYIHEMGFNEFDSMFETQEEIRDSKIDSILNG